MLRICIFIIVVLVNWQVSSQILFSNEANNLGLDNLDLGVTFAGNGVSFVDFNNDGWDDLSFSSGHDIAIKFFENDNGIFVESNWNLPDFRYQTKSLFWVDIENDGDKDLYIVSNTSNGNKLFVNENNGNFVDITLSSGLPIGNLESYSASWGDYNNDGFLDVFICNRGEGVFAPNRLYKNNGDTTFQDVSTSAGISNTSNFTFCSAFFDYNNDGWQDIYEVNDKDYIPNKLYKNNGDNTFSDVSIVSNTNISIDAMTATIGDYNNDGWFDIYVTNTQSGNVLLKNNGDGTFDDVAVLTGTAFYSIGWGAVFLDADNDRDLDLYVSGELDGTVGSYLSSAFYLNNGDQTFTIPSGIGFENDTGNSFSNAIGDIDNDGYPDIVVSNSNNQQPFLWKNETENDNNWLKINLEGVVSNRDGVGSRIEISINGQQYYRYTLSGEGYLSQNSNTEFFGLGTNTQVDYIKVTWLSGMVDYFESVSANQHITILEGSNPLSVSEFYSKPQLFITNPVSEFLHIKCTDILKEIKFYNLSGSLLKEINWNSKQLSVDISNFSDGVYVLKLVLEDNTVVKRIIKE
ncbi:hypothetical protein C1T31_11090 [Hanstruepera neustonica]|uniref:RNA-binding protein n=1 Tax=Hanstruepera neustonica TaxID=1445657 RepID=A0A2K1DXB9_9FLAO|nr:FG-GAP-like repeat-containing protein [Hanstruepera neustonica]PNQ72680.1 hypothetical protein C1T31_11090 [Hanstruepera neustonica]